MHITIERSLSADIVEEFLPVYQESFAHLAELSAAKQVLEDEEFRRLMRSPRTLKFCGWDVGDDLVAMALMTHDIALVPWASIPFFARHWPERIDTDHLAYLLTILVKADRRGEPWMSNIIEVLALHSAERDVLMVFDCCQFNIDVVDVPAMIKELGSRNSKILTELIDFQHYYAYRAQDVGLYDLTSINRGGVIDLRVPDLLPEVIDLRDDPSPVHTEQQQEVRP